ARKLRRPCRSFLNQRLRLRVGYPSFGPFDAAYPNKLVTPSHAFFARLAPPSITLPTTFCPSPIGPDRASAAPPISLPPPSTTKVNPSESGLVTAYSASLMT